MLKPHHHTTQDDHRYPACRRRPTKAVSQPSGGDRGGIWDKWGACLLFLLSSGGSHSKWEIPAKVGYKHTFLLLTSLWLSKKKNQVQDWSDYPPDFLGVSLQRVFSGWEIKTETLLGNTVQPNRRRNPTIQLLHKNSCHFAASTVESPQKFQQRLDEDRRPLSVLRGFQMSVSVREEGSVHTGLSYHIHCIYVCWLLDVHLQRCVDQEAVTSINLLGQGEMVRMKD